MDREAIDEIKRHFGVVGEGIRADVRTVADGVSLANERIDALQREVAREFAETRSMIKLSYSEVDRRLTGLENDMASPKARIERLESRAAS
ncbi:MAG: hypothetical protein KJ067_08670 [Vicinamibacteria bacterium]|nr:hypothetical protein [Vicinamibacteria bacterium]